MTNIEHESTVSAFNESYPLASIKMRSEVETARISGSHFCNQNGKRQNGMTLFEIAISLVIVSFGVISVFLLIPSVIKSQTQARYQILASARAVELIDIFSRSSTGSTLLDREAPFPWDVTPSYRAYAPDLEMATANSNNGLYPVPIEIARRFDSDNDEIQNILSNGGYVYYSSPIALSTFNQNAMLKNVPFPNETGKIICAVNGFAQQNAIPTLSYKSWPYYSAYPAPPIALKKNEDGPWSPSAPYSRMHKIANSYNQRGGGETIVLWENLLEEDDGEMGIVYRAVIKGDDQNLPLTTRWVKACDPGGVLENAVNQFGHLAYRHSGFLASFDKFGWIPKYNDRIYPPANGSSPSGWLQGAADTTIYPVQDPNPPQPAVLDRIRLNGAPVPNPIAGARAKELAKESALAYFALAKWYAKEKGVNVDILEGNRLDNNDPTLLNPTVLYANGYRGSPALAINAARILAQAAMALTHHFDNPQGDSFDLGSCEIFREGTYPFKENENGDSQATSRPQLTKIDSSIPRISTNGTPPFSGVNLAKIKNYVDNSMILAMRFSSASPYDWGSPRPMNRAIMMDNPLLQYDMFTDAGNRITPANVPEILHGFPGYNYGVRPTSARYGYSSTKSPAQWRFASAQPIVNVGKNRTFNNMNLAQLWPRVTTDQRDGQVDAAGHPNYSHFTLTSPFEPRQRARELVFWAVDWQSYEDFETAPSAPVDASRFPKTAPFVRNGQARSVDPSKLVGSGGDINYAKFWDVLQPGARNPEKLFAFLEPTHDKETGRDNLWVVGTDMIGDQSTNKPDHPGFKDISDRAYVTIDAPLDLAKVKPAMVFCGQNGADRNAHAPKMITTNKPPAGIGQTIGFLGRLDRGPVPRSVRMRATLIARFNFYDPRVPLMIR